MSSMTQPMGPVRSGLSLLVALGICFIAARLGSTATTPNLGWYEALQKPFFTPPNIAFPIAWTILYTMMGFSLWRVATRPTDRRARSLALGVFMVQLLLNVGWSFAFFGQQNPELGLIVVIALLVSIVVNIMVFLPLDRLAGWLLVPYGLWVTYAFMLNLAIWRMNG